MKTLFIVGSLFFTVHVAVAGECRTKLEPRLLSDTASPDIALFEICEAEANDGDPEGLYWVSFFYFGLLEATLDWKRGVTGGNGFGGKGISPGPILDGMAI